MLKLNINKMLSPYLHKNYLYSYLFFLIVVLTILEKLKINNFSRLYPPKPHRYTTSNINAHIFPISEIPPNLPQGFLYFVASLITCHIIVITLENRTDNLILEMISVYNELIELNNTMRYDYETNLDLIFNQQDVIGLQNLINEHDTRYNNQRLRR